MNAKWSLWSEDSFLCIGCRGSALSIGSIGSVLSIGSIGSAASAFSIGSAASVASALSAGSRDSIMSAGQQRAVMGRDASVPPTAILLSVAALGLALAARRRAGSAQVPRGVIPAAT